MDSIDTTDLTELQRESHDSVITKVYRSQLSS